MSGREIPDTVLDVQHRASDPAASAWVSANAGSGKTFVLAQRVIRLLLDGTPPAKILCLTYTKAAAANMANRVFERLAGWTTLDDTGLTAEIRRTGVKRIDAKLLAHARRLFAEALETPGGLKVQTIHAFCTRLLQQFPFEADVAARFQVLEEAQQTQMLEDIRLGVLLAASADPASAEGRALATIIPLASDYSFHTGVAEAIRERDSVTAWIEGAGSIDNAMAELSRALGIDPNDTIESVERELYEASLIAPAEWPTLIAALQQGSKTDREQAARLEIVRTATGAERFDALLSIFCTGDGAARASIVTKAVRDKHPALCARFADEQKRICAVLERRRAVMARTRTASLLTLASEMAKRYRAEKERRGLLDYDDLIAKARELLTRVGPSWVHYKLDLGIDHLLIDEAQDTSPEQWDIIRQLVAEFPAGAGARGMLKRSLFAVGDEKQSIFSFQGAAPHEFDTMRRTFRQTFQASEMEWRDVRLEYSFRSNDSVLDAVQQVFLEKDVFASVTEDEAGLAPHLALEDAAPGFVELWELVKPDERPEIDPWDAPFDKTSETSPRVKLARQIAKAVRRWIERRDQVGTGAERHAVRPGDILVLVRQRGPLFEAIIRALKNEDIEVAGADRLMLTEHIAVMDLLALADAVLLPEDDLALATVLKSPLFGLSEEELFALAWERKGPLRAALSERRPEIAARLQAIADDARKQSPFAFYANLLGADKARQRFLSRLGPEANDVIDEFLNLALTYESRETPSLQGFAAWLRTTSAEIKRDMEIARDEVRVMTVHGAKGLEAPVVILADTTTEPQGPPLLQPRLLALPDSQAAPGAAERLVWAPIKKEDTPTIAAARSVVTDAAIDEYRRLLYVAMTRAADRLVICGSVGERKRPDGCWYDLIVNALKNHCTEEPADIGEGTVLRYRKADAVSESPPPDVRGAAMAPGEIPGWLTRDGIVEPAPLAPLSPSQAYDENAPAARGDVGARKRALARGVVTHRLLQSLPEIPLAMRTDAAKRYLARDADAFTPEECEDMAVRVLRLLNDLRFSELFAPGSRAEVPIVGRISVGGREQHVNGVLDRLAVTKETVLIADYKTNRPPPAKPPQAYVAQLALYRAVLAGLYPGKQVRAALVWTEAPDLVELSAAELDAALAEIAASRQP